MPELPEIHSAARLINQVGKDLFFRSPIIRSDVSKSAALGWSSSKFQVAAAARGKEMQLILKDCDDGPNRLPDLKVTFNFGMSGRFSFNRFDQIPKHAHLQFFTTSNPSHALSFVDYRRFGRWEERDYDFTRGPDPVTEYAAFRQKVLGNLDKSVFNKAICEAIMDQEYFNGIGNYLRAEILYRARIPPFSKARGVLEKLPNRDAVDKDSPDLLDLCNLVPLEVFAITKPGEGYRPDPELEEFQPFRDWLRCYMKPGMKNLVDRQNRTVWFDGPAGEMVPANKASRHNGKRKSGTKNPSEANIKEEVPQELAVVEEGNLTAKPQKRSKKVVKKEADEGERVGELLVEEAGSSKRASKEAVPKQKGTKRVTKKELVIKQESRATNVNEKDLQPGKRRRPKESKTGTSTTANADEPLRRSTRLKKT